MEGSAQVLQKRVYTHFQVTFTTKQTKQRITTYSFTPEEDVAANIVK